MKRVNLIVITGLLLFLLIGISLLSNTNKSLSVKIFGLAGFAPPVPIGNDTSCTECIGEIPVDSCDPNNLPNFCRFFEDQGCGFVSDCNICGCPGDLLCNVDTGSCVGPEKSCLDGTHYGSCSGVNQYLFCNNEGLLVESCNECGCPLGNECTQDGICISVVDIDEENRNIEDVIKLLSLDIKLRQNERDQLKEFNYILDYKRYEIPFARFMSPTFKKILKELPDRKLEISVEELDEEKIRKSPGYLEIIKTTQTRTTNLDILRDKDIMKNNLDTSVFFDFYNTLLGYWSMDSYDKNLVYDNSSNDNHATYNGGASSSNIVNGKYGNALSLNGNSEYITVPSHDSLEVGSSDFSVELWFKQDVINTTVGRGLIDHESREIVGGKGWQLFILGQNNRIRMRIDDGPNYILLDSDKKITDTENWHHIVFTIDKDSRTGGRIYIDGVKESTEFDVTGIGDISSSQDYWIGYMGPDRYFDGMIDEVRIYKRVLTPEEISVSYNNKIYNKYGDLPNLPDGSYDYSLYIMDILGNLDILNLGKEITSTIKEETETEIIPLPKRTLKITGSKPDPADIDPKLSPGDKKSEFEILLSIINNKPHISLDLTGNII